jgi:hypothetical protein
MYSSSCHERIRDEICFMREKVVVDEVYTEQTDRRNSTDFSFLPRIWEICEEKTFSSSDMMLDEGLSREIVSMLILSA